MKKQKNIFIAALLLFSMVITGCANSDKGENSDNADAGNSEKVHTIADIKSEFDKDPQSAVSMIASNMNQLDSVHIDYTYDDTKDDGTGSRASMDIQKEDGIFVALSVDSYSSMIPAQCDASDLPDFGVNKGWDWREYCASLYGADFKSEPEITTESSYMFYNKNGNVYWSADGTNFENQNAGFENPNDAPKVNFTFEYLLGTNEYDVKEYQIIDNDNGGITVVLKRTLGDDSDPLKEVTWVLNENGYIMSTKEYIEGGYIREAGTEVATYSKFNETSFDYSRFQLAE